MNIFPPPVTNEDAIDALAFFEQILADYYIEYGSMFALLTEIRNELVAQSERINYGYKGCISKGLWEKCVYIYSVIANSEIRNQNFDGIEFHAKPSVPECRSYLPVEMQDVISNVKTNLYRYIGIGTTLILGIRTAGSWGGGLVAGTLRALGIRCNFTTIRPHKIRRMTKAEQNNHIRKFSSVYISGEELKQLKHYIQHSDSIILVDDPPSTGSTVSNTIAYLRSLNETKEIIFFPLGNMSASFSMNGCHLVYNRYREYTYEKLINLAQYKYKLTFGQGTMEHNDMCIPRKHILQFFNDGNEPYIAKYVGAGWYGKIEENRARILKSSATTFIGCINGYLIGKKELPLTPHNLKDLDRISALKNYFSLLLKHYCFRTLNGTPLIWHSNKYSLGNWCNKGGKIVRQQIEAGHWGKLIQSDVLLYELLTELQYSYDEISQIRPVIIKGKKEGQYE